MKVSATETIRAPKSDVFHAFADIEHAAERISGIEDLEILGETKWGQGLRWRETRKVFGKVSTEEMEITKFDEPSSYVVEAESHGTHYTSIFKFEDAEGGSTRIDWSFEGKPLSLVAKLFSPLGYVFRGSIRKLLLNDVSELKKYIESRSA